MKISVEEFDKLNENYQNLSSQIDKLASYIMENIEGEPSQSEGAVDCARENEHTAPDLANMNYELNCPDWEMKEEEEQN